MQLAAEPAATPAAKAEGARAKLRPRRISSKDRQPWSDPHREARERDPQVSGLDYRDTEAAQVQTRERREQTQGSKTQRGTECNE